MDCDLTGCIGRSVVSCLVCRLARKSRPINRDLIDKFPVVSFYPFWDHFLNDCQGSYFVPCMVIFCMPISLVNFENLNFAKFFFFEVIFFKSCLICHI